MKKQLVIGITCLLFSMMLPEEVTAAKAKNQLQVPLTGFSAIEDGGTTQISSDGENLTMVFDTAGLEDGYYTSFLSADVSSYNVNSSLYHSMEVGVRTSSQLNLNVNLIMEDGTVSIVEEKKTVYLKYDDTDQYEAVCSEYGVFSIPAGFSGKVFIPDTSMSSQEDSSHISNVAITLTQEANETSELILWEVGMSSDQYMESFTGEKTVWIPSVGCYNYQYSADVDATLSLESEREGVRIWQSGKLSLEETAKEGTIQIVAELEGKTYVYPVELGIQSSIPKAVAGVVLTEYKEKTATFLFPYLKGISAIIAVFFGIFYIRKVRRNRI